MQCDLFMYHLRSNYKNRLEFPFNDERQNRAKSLPVGELSLSSFNMLMQTILNY